MKNKILIFGYGYVAKALSENLNDFDIISTSRSDKKSSIAKIIDFDAKEIELELANTTHIISTIPPEHNLGDPVLSRFRDIIEKASNLKYLGYISATSVYGDHKGGWVDEESNLNVKGNRSKARYESEKEWQQLANDKDVPLIIFRIAGIYGPERNTLNQLKSGLAKSIYKEGLFFSRIHIDDIVSVIKSSITKDNKSEIYNLADDMPCPQYEIIEYASKLLNISPPKRIAYEEAELSDMAKDFYSQSKKVSNKKIKSKLGIKLKYPSYKEGLISIIEKEY